MLPYDQKANEKKAEAYFNIGKIYENVLKDYEL